MNRDDAPVGIINNHFLPVSLIFQIYNFMLDYNLYSLIPETEETEESNLWTIK